MPVWTAAQPTTILRTGRSDHYQQVPVTCVAQAHHDIGAIDLMVVTSMSDAFVDMRYTIYAPRHIEHTCRKDQHAMSSALPLTLRCQSILSPVGLKLPDCKVVCEV
jgi:hypothetical protein